MNLGTVPLMGYDVSDRGLVGDVAHVAQWCADPDAGMRYMACLNPHSLVVAKSDETFRLALQEADLLLPDGAGILLASRVLGAGLPERVAGMEFFLGLCEHAEQAGGFSFFFLGSSERALALIRNRLARDYPNIDFAGGYSPPFKAEYSSAELDDMIQAVNAARPTVLWVGMTAPKQEKWIHVNRDRLRVPFAGAIGAVFDFYAGTTERAPAWAQQTGLEWLVRFAREPRRLWRRNLVSTPLFLFEILKTALAARAWRPARGDKGSL